MLVFTFDAFMLVLLHGHAGVLMPQSSFAIFFSSWYDFTHLYMAHTCDAENGLSGFCGVRFLHVGKTRRKFIRPIHVHQRQLLIFAIILARCVKFCQLDLQVIRISTRGIQYLRRVLGLSYHSVNLIPQQMPLVHMGWWASFEYCSLAAVRRYFFALKLFSARTQNEGKRR